MPQVYFVPRDGSVARAVVQTRDELYDLRTELEILRRVRRAMAGNGSSSPTDQRQAALRSVRVIEKKYSAEDRHDLSTILKDATHPIVDEMIALVDDENDRIRKEIMMSVINEEAERIVHEAAESGVLDPSNPAPEESADRSGEGSLDGALAEAEAELAAAVGLTESVTTPDDPLADEEHNAALPTPAEATSAHPDETVLDDAVDEETGSEPPPSDRPEPVDTHPSTPFVDEAPQSGNDEPQSASPTDEERSTPSGRTNADFDADYTPQRAERAVVEIEQGIRKLATLLSTEVNEQWKHAQEAFAEVAETRGKMVDADRQARGALDAILRLREEAQIARDDANVARREAKLLREDAKRAKERADASATAAELSADQAKVEALSARDAEAIRNAPRT